jgi:hypothetical protein
VNLSLLIIFFPVGISDKRKTVGRYGPHLLKLAKKVENLRSFYDHYSPNPFHPEKYKHSNPGILHFLHFLVTGFIN